MLSNVILNLLLVGPLAHAGSGSGDLTLSLYQCRPALLLSLQKATLFPLCQLVCVSGTNRRGRFIDEYVNQ